MRFVGTLTLLLYFNSCIVAQNFVEVGGIIGFANYQGDLTQVPITFGETKYSFGGFAEYHYNPKLHFRIQGFYGRISGDDANGDASRQTRNWSFQADMLEASVQMLIMPFAKPRINKVGLFRPQINPYLGVGVGLSFAARKELNLNRDGSTFNFERLPFPDFPPEPDDRDNFLVFPVGGGIRFDLTQWTTLSADFAWRYTNSDYLDGVSKNGADDGPDWYIFLGVSLSTYFGEQEDYGL